MARVLYISWTEKMSGGEISILNYIKELQEQDKKNFSPIFVCPKKGALSERLQKENIPVFFIPGASFSFKKPWHFFIALAKLILLIKKEKITLIHNTSFYSNQIAVLAGKSCSVPVITHGQSFVNSSEITRNLLPHADKILVCSHAVKKSLIPFVNKNKVQVLWHAVPLHPHKKKSFFLHKELHIPKEYILIGHIGLLEQRKRQEDTLQAAATVLQQKKKVCFLIIGNAQFGNRAYESYIHNITQKLDIQQHVYFLGFRSDIQDIIQELDIVVLPSLHEPFSIAMLEAMSLEKPFIGAESGGTPELIQHMKNGLIISPKDHVALAQAILFLLRNKKLAKNIGKNGRASVQEKCNIKEYVKRLATIYAQVKSEKKR